MAGNYGDSAGKAGVGFGVLLAAVISWSKVQSLCWLIVQAMFGWAYVIWKWVDGGIHW